MDSSVSLGVLRERDLPRGGSSVEGGRLLSAPVKLAIFAFPFVMEMDFGVVGLALAGCAGTHSTQHAQLFKTELNLRRSSQS